MLATDFSLTVQMKGKQGNKGLLVTKSALNSSWISQSIILLKVEALVGFNHSFDLEIVWDRKRYIVLPKHGQLTTRSSEVTQKPKTGTE